eukprot:7851029-Ditylum_brightwellii.AAC.1
MMMTVGWGVVENIKGMPEAGSGAGIGVSIGVCPGADVGAGTGAGAGELYGVVVDPGVGMAVVPMADRVVDTSQADMFSNGVMYHTN